MGFRPCTEICPRSIVLALRRLGAGIGDEGLGFFDERLKARRWRGKWKKFVVHVKTPLSAGGRGPTARRAEAIIALPTEIFFRTGIGTYIWILSNNKDVNDYLAREVLPHVPDAYIDQTYRDEIDHQVGIVGFEINFNRYFYEFKLPRSLHEIDEDLKAVSRSIMSALEDLAE